MQHIVKVVTIPETFSSSQTLSSAQYALPHLFLCFVFFPVMEQILILLLKKFFHVSSLISTFPLLTTPLTPVWGTLPALHLVSVTHLPVLQSLSVQRHIICL